MKIQEGLYFCHWCELEFKQSVNKVGGQTKKGVGVDQCICPKCGRYVSQKTKSELLS